MKIFISHSSKNKILGEALVDLLKNIGIKDSEIVFTSNTVYGIPVGQNIFNWLKSQITENPFVIYLLSEEYYKSIACLNEMGAAWIIENKHAAIFTQNFDLSSKEFQSGALDPREIGFYINDEERILSFVEILREHFEITLNPLIITQSVRKFIKSIDQTQIDEPTVMDATSNNTKSEIEDKIKPANVSTIIESSSNIIAELNDIENQFTKFSSLITSKKLKDEELILLHYIIERGKFSLMTGWQEQSEIENIKEWEEIHDISPILSKNYPSILKRFLIRGFLEVSEVTSYGNPKEFKMKDEIAEQLLDLDENLLNIINDCLKRNHYEHITQTTNNDDDLPF